MVTPADNLSELIEILDNLGNPTGKTTSREEIHLKGLPHKSVHIHIINDKNQLLLQKRSATKLIFPNVWAPAVGGHISAGEDLLCTAIRETKEEVNLDITASQLNFIGIVKDSASYRDHHENEFLHIFTMNLPEEIDLNISNNEVSGLKWFKIQELEELVETKSLTLLPFYLEFSLILGYLKTS